MLKKRRKAENMVNKTVKKIFEVVLFVLLICMIFVLALGIRYAMPAIDDFNFAKMLRTNKHYPNLFVAIFSQALWMYKYWQGAWFTNHLDMLAVGITKLSYNGVRVYLVLAYILFTYSLIKLVSTIEIVIPKVNKNLSILSCLVAVWFTGLNLTPCREELYWLTGAGGYTIPMAVAFLGISHYIVFFRFGKKKDFWLSCVFLACASGGALNVAGFACAFGLCVVMGYSIFKNRKGDKDASKRGVIAWCPFITGTISALLNVLSPGNFDRLGSESEQGFSLFTAIINTARQLIVRLYALYENQYIVLAVIVLFFVFIWLLDGTIYVSGMHVLYVILSEVVILGATCFPVCLGYGRVTKLERIVFLVDLEIVLAIVALVVVIALWIKRIMPDKVECVNWISVIPILILLAYLNIRTVGVANTMFYKTISEFNDGTLRDYAATTEHILDEIKNSSEANVEIEVDSVVSDVALGLGVSPGKDHWVNERISHFYGKESVTVKFK